MKVYAEKLMKTKGKFSTASGEPEKLMKINNLSPRSHDVTENKGG
jgi:hypothetical protein